MSRSALIYTYLTAAAMPGVGDRVFPHLIPYDQRQPYDDSQVAVSYEVTGITPVEDKYQPAGVDVLRLQVNCYGRYYEKAEAALDHLRSYLDMRKHETVDAGVIYPLSQPIPEATWAGTSSPALTVQVTSQRVEGQHYVQRIRYKDTRSLYDDQARLAGRQDEYELRIINAPL